ncbi:MAG: hypothetical protein ACK2T4_01825 [Candidatus Promineifilaceae bacterium]|jgi:hypothetical protein
MQLNTKDRGYASLLTGSKKKGQGGVPGLDNTVQKLRPFMTAAPLSFFLPVERPAQQTSA